ncbi:MAG: 30S ribosomal protein S1 [Firmicutes bacterium]|nr:30S ribosomal protein S1 [Bacillota bacterium]
MSEIDKTQSFQEMLDESFTTLKSGNIVSGTVVRVTPTEVIVDLGFKSDGIISRSDFSDDQTTELSELAKPGDTIDVWVLRVNDGDGNVVCSKKKVDSQAGLKSLEAAFNDKTVLHGKVVDVVKGGLTVNIEGCRAFVPSSQVSNRFVKDLEEFKGKEFDFQILEFERDRNRRLRIIAGRRELAAKEAEERHNAIFSNIVVDQRIEGTVSRIVDFGAFIDLGGVDALLHITELSWSRVRKVTDVLKIGDKITAIVKDFNPETGKISLSLKDAKDNPWFGILEKYPIDSIVKGTVVRFAQFGAFVHLEDGVDGLVHISQIADKRVAKPADELEIGQVIDVKVVAIDEENKKISLSKREADAILNPPPVVDEHFEEEVLVNVSDYMEETPEEQPVAEEVSPAEAAEEVIVEEASVEVVEETAEEVLDTDSTVE